MPNFVAWRACMRFTAFELPDFCGASLALIGDRGRTFSGSRSALIESTSDVSRSTMSSQV